MTLMMMPNWKRGMNFVSRSRWPITGVKLKTEKRILKSTFSDEIIHINHRKTKLFLWETFTRIIIYPSLMRFKSQLLSSISSWVSVMTNLISLLIYWTLSDNTSALEHPYCNGDRTTSQTIVFETIRHNMICHISTQNIF